MCPDHDGRGLRRRGSRPLLRPRRRAARRRRQPPHAGRVGGRDGGARRRRPRHAQGRSGRRLPVGRPRPIPRTTCAASTTATSTSTASPRTRRPRRTARCDSRSTTGAGPASRSSSARASASRRPRPSFASCSSGRRKIGFAALERSPEPDQLVVKLDPSTGVRFRLEALEPTRSEPSRSRSTSSSRSRAARARRPTRCCCTRRWSATARASPVRTASRRRGASCSRCSTRRRRCTPYAPGSWGPKAADKLVAGHGTLARAVGGGMTTVEPTADRDVQSAAAPSPFPPIADYAFLSNCHTGALVAPDGSIDWLCVPSFDSPSVFGSLLDREAGLLPLRRRSGSTTRPRARTSPGTNVLETTWKTPNGWIVVRDALTMGPRDHEDTVTPHTRPPADDDADHMLVRTVECLEGSVEVELVCEPVFDYGRAPGGVDAGRRRPPRRRRARRRADRAACGRTWRSASRATGSAARHVLERRRPRLLRALVGRGARRRRRTSRRRRRGSPRRPLLARLAGTGRGSRITAGATRSSAPR